MVAFGRTNVMPNLASVEAYLDQLLGHLRDSDHDVRRILSETEEEAQRRAIERFGHPRTVARRFSVAMVVRLVRAELAGPAPA
jgi:hypothetical protein